MKNVLFLAQTNAMKKSGPVGGPLLGASCITERQLISDTLS
jgi:hypothetical protein